jgi:16S rRNA (cytosine967-C5)-methyltransferase
MSWQLPSNAANELRGSLDNTIVQNVYRLQGEPSVLKHYFTDGLFQVQDLASFSAVLAGRPNPQDQVLDVCSATGSKTCGLAQVMANRGHILSVDVSADRFRSWKNQIRRMNVQIADPVLLDARRLNAVHDMFDLVLVDPPCTGSGVFDRNPRMKWHISPDSIMKYATIQHDILQEASRFVKPTGRIVYSTCSITIEENEHVIANFLRSHPDFETKPILPRLGSAGLNGLNDAERFYPHKDGTAGYFVVQLEKSDYN